MNKIIIYMTIFASILMIAVPTLYKVIKSNHDNLYIVTNKLITEAAEKCYFEDKCKDKKITLKELYDNNYLQRDIVNPVDKVIYKESSYVIISKDESIFYPM